VGEGRLTIQCHLVVRPVVQISVSNTEVGQDGILRAVGNRAERPINNRLQVANLPHIKTELA